MDHPTLQLNCSRPAEFEFDVQLQGLSSPAAPTVRFTIVTQHCVACFPCTAVSDSKWRALIPALDTVFADLTEISYPFRVEVIVDGYYFEPAQGTISVIANPKVAVGQNRPTAQATIMTPSAPESPVTAEAPQVKLALLQKVAEPVTEPVVEQSPAPAAEPPSKPVLERAPPVKPKRSIFKIKKLETFTR